MNLIRDHYLSNSSYSSVCTLFRNYINNDVNISWYYSHPKFFDCIRTSDVAEQHADADDEDNGFDVNIVDGIDGTVNCRNNRLLIRCNRRPIRRVCLSKSSPSSSSSFLI